MGSDLELGRRLGIGIIGFGGFGRFLRQSWSGMESASVVAVADVNPVSGADDLNVYRDWREMLRDSSIDLVSIATPPDTHAELAGAAMAAGKHVLVEKPLCTTREAAQALVAQRDAAGVRAAVNFMLRFNPIVEVMQDWARRKPFGSLRRVLVENYAQDEALPVDHWFWDPSVSGGILVEHAVHFIDVVHGCTRAPAVRVNGTSAAREDGRIDRMSLTAVYGDGLIMSQYHAFSRPGFFESTSMRFVFDLAEVDVEGWIPLGGRARVLVSESTDKDAIQLPGARVIHRVPIRQAADLSRPRGWGGQDIGADRSHAIASSGVNYDVQEQVMVEFGLPDDKSTVYAACLQAMMRDVIEAIRNPHRQLRVTLEDGATSLDVALRATASARQGG